MKTTVEIIPRRQLESYLHRKERWACMVLHRRAGKSFVCIQDLIVKALTNPRTDPPPRYAYLAPTRDQAKDIVWKYLSVFAGDIPATEVNKADLSLTFHNGASIRLYSGDAFERLRGIYLDGIVMDEAADIDPAAWDNVIRPTLTDYRGFATWVGTPKGRDSFHRIFINALNDPNWFTLMLKASESGIIPEDELNDIKSGISENAFQQEYECSFSISRRGAIYARLLETARTEQRISNNILWHKESPVFTSWDVGAPLNQRVWIWQMIGDRILMLESLFGSPECGTPAEWVARLNQRPYAYGGHFIPHDAATANGGLWQGQLGIAGLRNVVAVPRQNSVWDGINLALEAFNRVSFIDSQCTDGIDALDQYHSKEESDGVTIKDIPVHDHSSHAADAFSIAFQAIKHGLVVDRSKLPSRINPANRPRQAIMGIRG